MNIRNSPSEQLTDTRTAWFLRKHRATRHQSPFETPPLSAVRFRTGFRTTSGRFRSGFRKAYALQVLSPRNALEQALRERFQQPRQKLLRGAPAHHRPRSQGQGQKAHPAQGREEPRRGGLPQPQVTAAGGHPG